MKPKKTERKSLLKTILAAAVIIGSSTLLFQGLTQAAAAGELKKTNIVSADYVNQENQASPTAQSNPPAGYVKANYTVETIDLPAYRSQKPTINDLTREEAAEIGAQALWSVYKLNLEDQVIQMGYNEAEESFPRDNWFGYIKINDNLSYHFYIDSITGELFSIGCTRTLEENVPLGFDLDLMQNPQEYIKPVKELAEKHNVVHGAVKSVEYGGQGYQSNDPDIQFDIIGENGERAQINVSRYDKALLSITYNASYKYTLEYLEKLEEESRKRATEMNRISPPGDENQKPLLLIDEGF